MVAVLKAAAQQEAEFDLGACATLAGPMVGEKEFNLRMKAMYFCERHGDVCVTSVWVHDVHDKNEYGGLPYWKAFHFPRAFVRQIEHAIEDHFRTIEEKERA